MIISDNTILTFGKHKGSKAKDIKKYQKDFEEGKYSNRNFQTHTDDPYYIPGEQGW